MLQNIPKTWKLKRVNNRDITSSQKSIMLKVQELHNRQMMKNWWTTMKLLVAEMHLIVRNTFIDYYNFSKVKEKTVRREEASVSSQTGPQSGATFQHKFKLICAAKTDIFHVCILVWTKSLMKHWMGCSVTFRKQSTGACLQIFTVESITTNVLSWHCTKQSTTFKDVR